MYKLVILFFIFSSHVLANSYIDQFDLKTYSPVKKGLSDLYFEVRKPELKSIIETTTGTKLKGEVFFKIYWTRSSKYLVEIEGYPNGFEELRSNLNKFGEEVIDYVIPRSPKEIFDNFELNSGTKKGSQTVFLGKSKDPNSPISEIQVFFDENGMLSSLITLSQYARNNTKFSHSKNKWTDNKYLTDAIETIITKGKQKLKIEKKLEYIGVAGYALPKSVVIKVKPMTSEKSVENESEITISNYKINLGIAGKKLVKKATK